MFNLINTYTWNKNEQIIPFSTHGISGLGNISHFNSNTSTNPITLHYHSDLFEIHCVTKGTRHFNVYEGKNLISYHITGNELFFTRPFELHSHSNHQQMPCEYYGCQINLSNPKHILGLNEEYSQLLFNRLSALKNRHLYMSHTLATLIQTAFNLLSSNNLEDKITGVQSLTYFFFNLYYMSPVQNDTASPIDERIQHAINYTIDNISKPLSVEELAKVSGYSVSRFKGKFKTETGFTPAEYITFQKIETAKYLLETSDLNITDLAYELGFSSSSYFATVFKKIMGCTPYVYKKEFISTTIKNS